MQTLSLEGELKPPMGRKENNKRAKVSLHTQCVVQDLHFLPNGY